MNQLPEAFLTRMRRQLEAEFEAYMTAMAQPPRRGGRVNGLKLSPEALFAIRPEFVPVGNEQFLLPEGTAPGKDPLHCAGAYYIQELSAQMPASLLDVEPGMAVLDLCAAPGGKSAQLGQALQGQGLLVSNEIVPGRTQILCGNLERMGIENALITSMEPEALCSSTGPVFDRVLLLKIGQLIEDCETDALLAQFCAVSGREDVVDAACAGHTPLRVETMGRQKCCTLRTPAADIAARGLDVDVTPLALYQVFVALCGGEVEP